MEVITSRLLLLIAACQGGCAAVQSCRPMGGAAAPCERQNRACSRAVQAATLATSDGVTAGVGITVPSRRARRRLPRVGSTRGFAVCRSGRRSSRRLEPRASWQWPGVGTARAGSRAPRSRGQLPGSGCFEVRRRCRAPADGDPNRRRQRTRHFVDLRTLGRGQRCVAEPEMHDHLPCRLRSSGGGAQGRNVCRQGEGAPPLVTKASPA